MCIWLQSLCYPADPGPWTGGERGPALESQAKRRASAVLFREWQLSFCLCLTHVWGYGDRLPKWHCPLPSPLHSLLYTIFWLHIMLLLKLHLDSASLLGHYTLAESSLSLCGLHCSLSACSTLVEIQIHGSLPSVWLSWNNIQAIPIPVQRYDMIVVPSVYLKCCTEERAQNWESKNLGSHLGPATSW